MRFPWHSSTKKEIEELKKPAVREVEFDDLQTMTNDFRQENYIGNFQFGKLYRGMWEIYSLVNYDWVHVTQEVLVKMWEDSNDLYTVRPGDNYRRVKDEVYLFKHSDLNDQLGMSNVFGYCADVKHLAIVYLMKPLDTVYNLLSNDGFTWLQRIKVALQFARLLEHMHTPVPPRLPYLIRNIDAAHIMLDQDHNPKLIDFGMTSGGILPDKRFLVNQYVHGCNGYIDPYYSENGEWSEKCDVYAFGVLLSSLIRKTVDLADNHNFGDAHMIDMTAQNRNLPQRFTKSKLSIVHPNLEADGVFCFDDGCKITSLALKCTQKYPHMRPTMTQVLKCLLDLHCVRYHIKTHSHNAKIQMTKISGFWWLAFMKLDLYPKCVRLKMTASFDSAKVFIPGMFSSNLPIHALKSEGEEAQISKVVYPQIEKKPGAVKPLSYRDLTLYTRGLSNENLIGKFHYGKVYRGNINEQEVTVKIWEYSSDPDRVRSGSNECGDNERKLIDELILLQHPRIISHPNIVNIFGYCFEGEEQLGVVYNLRPFDTLYNLVLKGDFLWQQRIKVALQFANLLAFLHSEDPPYLVLNIDLLHIMLDQNRNLVLFDFGMIIGGVLADRRRRRCSYAHIESDFYKYDDSVEDKSDVYSFGSVLLCLVARRLFSRENGVGTKPGPTEWVGDEYKEYTQIQFARGLDASKFSLVHESLAAEPTFHPRDGLEITRLVIDCMSYRRCNRPSMQDIVQRLLNLNVVKCGAVDLAPDSTNSHVDISSNI